MRESVLHSTLTRRRRAALVALALAGFATAALPSRAAAQWSTTYDQYYLPGKFNWKFRNNYPAAERLFNAFDYGHAILYEKLWTRGGNAQDELERKEYDFITRKLLVRPPNVALEESAIEVAYAKLAPEAKAMFDWAHLLHRQIYDVWSDESLSDAERDAKVQELIRYYKTRPDLAFSSKPKTMELMEGQPYSTAFRKNYPKFNGLIWAYHWLQVGLYEPLVTAKTPDEKQAGVNAAVARFRQMLLDPPRTMPYIMPMTAAIAPEFSRRYPEAAIIFDNLHSMHDVVSDILANASVPKDRKRAEIVLAARRYRDDTSYVETPAQWREMAQMMGVENMGGPAVGFLAQLPTPTVERGAVMAGMDHSKMPGMRMSHTSDMPGMSHGDGSKTGGMAHEGHAASDSGMAGMHAMHGTDSTAHRTMMELHARMMADSVIRKRMESDPEMRRMLQEMERETPAEHRMSDMPGMEGMTHEPTAKATTSKGRTTSAKGKPTKPAKKPATKPAAKAKPDPMANMPGMDHGKMPGMKKP